MNAQLYLKWGSHIYNAKFHSISYITPSLFSNTYKIICNVKSVQCMCVLICKSQKREMPKHYSLPWAQALLIYFLLLSGVNRVLLRPLYCVAFLSHKIHQDTPIHSSTFNVHQVAILKEAKQFAVKRETEQRHALQQSQADLQLANQRMATARASVQVRLMSDTSSL